MSGRKHRKKRNNTFPRLSLHFERPQLSRPREPECVVCEVSPPVKKYPLQVVANGETSTIFVVRDTLWWVWSRVPSSGLAPLVALDDFGVPRPWEEDDLALFFLVDRIGWWVDG